MLFRVWHGRQELKYRIYVPVNACESGFKLMHLGEILMNGNVKIGRNCSIHIGVKLVADGYTSDAPRIGNNVVIGVNSVLCGGIEIADNVAIGACSFVNKSFGEGTIAGVPAKIISNRGREA